MKESHYGKKYISFSKEKHWNWKGGITSENDKIRHSSDYKNWRRKVFEKDEYTCQLCKIKGGYLNADHIKSFSHHPHLRLEISNGRTLCVDCHKKTPNYGGKNNLP